MGEGEGGLLKREGGGVWGYGDMGGWGDGREGDGAASVRN